MVKFLLLSSFGEQVFVEGEDLQHAVGDSLQAQEESAGVIACSESVFCGMVGIGADFSVRITFLFFRKKLV